GRGSVHTRFNNSFAERFGAPHSQMKKFGIRAYVAPPPQHSKPPGIEGHDPARGYLSISAFELAQFPRTEPIRYAVNQLPQPRLVSKIDVGVEGAQHARAVERASRPVMQARPKHCNVDGQTGIFLTSRSVSTRSATAGFLSGHAGLLIDLSHH